jgi:hypothetical protein
MILSCPRNKPHLEEHAVVDLTQAEQLHDLAGFGVQCVDTPDAHGESQFRLCVHVEGVVLLRLPLQVDQVLFLYHPTSLVSKWTHPAVSFTSPPKHSLLTGASHGRNMACAGACLPYDSASFQKTSPAGLKEGALCGPGRFLVNASTHASFGKSLGLGMYPF